MAATFNTTTSISVLGTSNSFTSSVTTVYGGAYGTAPAVAVAGSTMTSWSVAFASWTEDGHVGPVPTCAFVIPAASVPTGWPLTGTSTTFTVYFKVSGVQKYVFGCFCTVTGAGPYTYTLSASALGANIAAGGQATATNADTTALITEVYLAPETIIDGCDIDCTADASTGATAISVTSSRLGLVVFKNTTATTQPWHKAQLVGPSFGYVWTGSAGGSQYYSTLGTAGTTPRIADTLIISTADTVTAVAPAICIGAPESY